MNVEPDHRVARRLLDPEDRVVGQEAQRDVGEDHQRHRREQHDDEPAVDGEQDRRSKFAGIVCRTVRWAADSRSGRIHAMPRLRRVR